MVTTVVLIRHAKPIQETAVDDFIKSLSEEGKLIQKRMDQYIKHRLITPDLIWYSPFKRTEETAEIIGQDFGIAPQEELALGEFFDEDELLQKLPSPDKNLCVFMVGHGPQLMRLATYCVGFPCYPTSPSLSSALVLDFPGQIGSGKGKFMYYFSTEDLLGFRA